MKKTLLSVALLTGALLSKAQCNQLSMVNNSVTGAPVTMTFMGTNTTPPCTPVYTSSGYYLTVAGGPISSLFAPSMTWSGSPTPPVTDINFVTITRNPGTPMEEILSFPLCAMVSHNWVGSWPLSGTPATIDFNVPAPGWYDIHVH